MTTKKFENIHLLLFSPMKVRKMGNARPWPEDFKKDETGFFTFLLWPRAWKRPLYISAPFTWCWSLQWSKFQRKI